MSKTEKTLKKRKLFADFATKRQQHIVITRFHSTFAENSHAMEKGKYELFAVLLEEEKIHLVPGVTFEGICRWIGEDTKEMDSYLESELGCNGKGILEAYRQGTRKRLKEKYGIEL